MQGEGQEEEGGGRKSEKVKVGRERGIPFKEISSGVAG